MSPQGFQINQQPTHLATSGDSCSNIQRQQPPLTLPHLRPTKPKLPAHCATHRKWMADSGETPHASNDHSTNGPRGLKTYNLRAADTPSAAEQESHAEDEPSLTSPASIASPPYWVQSHTRSFSNISVESVNGGITLLDNTDEGSDSKTSSACWAKHVYIEDHTVINGSRTGIGAFVVWNVTVETLHVGG